VTACTCHRCLALGAWNRPRRDMGQTKLFSKALGRHVLGHELADMTAMHERDAWAFAIAWAANSEIEDLQAAVASSTRIALLRAASAGTGTCVAAHERPCSSPEDPAAAALEALNHAYRAAVRAGLFAVAEALVRLGANPNEPTEDKLTQDGEESDAG
jgi:hypothetical protein